MSEKERVVRAVRGDPWKKLVVVRSGRRVFRKRGTMSVDREHTLEILEEVGDCFTFVF